MNMKRMFALVVMMLLLVSAVPAMTGKPGLAGAADRLGVATDAAGEEPADETRLEKCIRLAQDNTGIEDPEAVCKRIITHGKVCVEVLEEEGVERPVLACTRLGIAVAEQVREVNQERREALTTLRTEVKERLGQSVKEVVAEHRLDRVARLQEVRSDAADFVAGLPEDKQKVFLNLGRAKQKEVLEMDSDDADAELGKFKVRVVKNNMLFKNRVIDTAKMLKADGDFKAAKAEYDTAKEELREARKAFDDAKKSGDSEAAMEAAKDYLLFAADIEIAALEKIQGKVEGSEELTEEEAAEIIADVDAKLTELEDAKAAAEAATTKEEVQEAAKTILRIGKNIKVRFARHVMRMKYRQVGVVVERSAHLEERFDCAVTTLEENGIDTASIQTLMDEFSAKVESAREKFSQADEMLKEAKALRDTDETGEGQVTGKVQESRMLLQEAQSDLKDAHTILKDILREAKASGGNVGACATKDADLEADEEVVIEEIDDDDYEDIEVPEEEEEEIEEEDTSGDDDSSEGTGETDTGDED